MHSHTRVHSLNRSESYLQPGGNPCLISGLYIWGAFVVVVIMTIRWWPLGVRTSQTKHQRSSSSSTSSWHPGVAHAALAQKAARRYNFKARASGVSALDAMKSGSAVGGEKRERGKSGLGNQEKSHEDVSPLSHMTSGIQWQAMEAHKKLYCRVVNCPPRTHKKGNLDCSNSLNASERRRVAAASCMLDDAAFEWWMALFASPRLPGKETNVIM